MSRICKSCNGPWADELTQLAQQGLRARAIHTSLKKAGATGLPTVENIHKHLANHFDPINEDGDLLAQARRLEAEAIQAGFEVAAVKVSSGGSEWDAQTKAGQELFESKRKAASLTLKPGVYRFHPADIQTAPDVNVTIKSSARLPKRAETDLKCAVIHADSQIWYHQRSGEWQTSHDESALDISLQVSADVEATHGIDTVVDLGDLVDFPNVSTHQSPHSMLIREACNRAVARTCTLLAERTALSPNAKRIWIRGNHEQRMDDWVAREASPLLGLRAEGDETQEPLLSLYTIFNPEKYGWDLLRATYPNGEYWLNHNTRCIHGTVAKTQVGATLNTYLTEEVNTIAGHTPHAGLAYRTVVRGGKTRTFLAHTPGGYMRRDNTVASQKTRNNSVGEIEPGGANPWEQGMSVVFYAEDGSTVPVVEHIPIYAGRAVWRGREYLARCDANGNEIEVAA